jgi:site-specific DNA-methyltransferase (adenine-specific)
MIPDKSIDMILCDLPYGTTACKWDTIIPFEQLWAQYERVIKDNGAIALTASQPFTTTLINSNFKNFKYCLVWNKDKAGNFALAKKRPLISHEDIVVFYKKQPTYNPQMTESRSNRDRTKEYKRKESNSVSMASGVYKAAKDHNEKLRYPKSILDFKKQWRPQDSLHPTQKPVDLFAYLIRTYTNEGDLVLDNCMGSGTTAIAALRTGRQFIGFELEREYVEIANKRIDNELEAN